MNKKYLLIILLVAFIGGQSSAQGGHLLLLKDRGVTIRSFSVGDYINFEFSNQQWLTGYVTWIKNDSIEINQFALQRVMGYYGTYGEDTLKLGRLKLQLNEIRAFAKDRGHFNSVFTNGSFLKAGGILYIGLNIINSISKNDPVFEEKNIPRLAGGVIAFVAGKLIQRANPNYRPIGKRFSLEIL